MVCCLEMKKHPLFQIWNKVIRSSRNTWSKMFILEKIWEKKLIYHMQLIFIEKTTCTIYYATTMNTKNNATILNYEKRWRYVGSWHELRKHCKIHFMNILWSTYHLIIYIYKFSFCETISGYKLNSSMLYLSHMIKQWKHVILAWFIHPRYQWFEQKQIIYTVEFLNGPICVYYFPI